MMGDENKSREQLLEELAHLRQRLASAREPWEDASRESEEGYRLLVESATDYAIFMVGVDGRVISWNEGAEHVFGYREAEIVGEPSSLLFVPEDVRRGAHEEELREAAAEGRAEDERWHVHKNGSHLWTSGVVTPVRNDSDELRGFVKVARDFTERKRAREEIKRLNKERFDVVVESVKDYAIFMLDPEGRVTTWNEGARRIKGYEAEEIVGEHFSIFYLPEDIERGYPGEVLRRAVEEGSYEEERLRVRKDGSRFWASVVITALWEEGGDLRGFAKVVRDITERQRSEQTQRWQAELLELSLEPILAWELDGGGIVYWNRGCEELYGFTKEEALGRESHRLLRTVHPVPLEHFEATLEHDGRWDGELEHTTRDGRRVVVESRHAVVRAADGRRLVQETNRDVTGRKKAEEERERLLGTAERRAAELAIIIDSVPDALYVGNENGMTLCNEAALQMLGFESVEELNQQIHLLAERIQTRYADTGGRIPPEEQPFSRALGGETCVREVIARHLKTGRDVVLRSAAAPIRHEGRVVGAVTINTDITEQKRAEEELRRSSERITNILESITDAFFTLDKEWRFTYLNRQAERLLRRPREELLGKNQYEEFPEAVGSSLQEKYHEAVESGRSVYFEKFYAPLGIWVELSAYPSEEGLSVYFRDVTERKRTEEVLMKTREAERRRISRDLHDMVLQDLSGVLQALQLTQMRAGRSASDLDLTEEIEALRRAAAGLRGAVYDLRLRREGPFPRAVEELLEFERRAAPERKFDLSVRDGFPQELPGTVGTELLRLLREALTNARNHSGAGWVEVSLGVNGDQVWVEVADDGRGFDPAGTVETPGGGTGLSTMRERVESLGGRFEIRSRTGEGTRVVATVSLRFS